MTSAAPRRRGFTLVELLVVIGIIALLISILMPALSRAREQAARTQCMSNQKQLLLGIIMYTEDFKGAFPFSGWDSQAGVSTDGSKIQVNWLYDKQAPLVNTPNGTAYNLKLGHVYKYLKNDKIFRCPMDEPPYPHGPGQRTATFGMNGSVNWYGKNIDGKVPFFKKNQYKSDDILLWETDENGSPGYWNDGANFPSEGISRRHGSKNKNADPKKDATAGALVGCVGGHVDRMTLKDFYNEETKRPGRLWNVPRRYSASGI
jgi:prepilin-type N-terminal cleavage/methylation domain-containing protein